MKFVVVKSPESVSASPERTFYLRVVEEDGGLSVQISSNERSWWYLVSLKPENEKLVLRRVSWIGEDCCPAFNNEMSSGGYRIKDSSDVTLPK